MKAVLEHPRHKFWNTSLSVPGPIWIVRCSKKKPFDLAVTFETRLGVLHSALNPVFEPGKTGCSSSGVVVNRDAFRQALLGELLQFHQVLQGCLESPMLRQQVLIFIAQSLSDPLDFLLHRQPPAGVCLRRAKADSPLPHDGPLDPIPTVGTGRVATTISCQWRNR